MRSAYDARGRGCPQCNPLSGQNSFRRGTWVRATDGKAGLIDRLLVDPMSGSLTHLVAGKEPMWASKAVPVPIAEARHIGEKAV